MTSLQDIISAKQEKDVESDNDSFAEADAIPVVPNRPARSKKSEAVPQAEAAVPTPPVPQRPKKRSTEESNSASVPVIPQRPLKKEVGPIVVQEEDSDLNEEVEPDKVNDNKDIDDNLLRPDYNEREAQIEAITSDAESIAELDEYDDERMMREMEGKNLRQILEQVDRIMERRNLSLHQVQMISSQGWMMSWKS
ncbi:unnamed protein product [Cyberlindnera jadinii]|uniref:Uncharacterized protein n=1 Tax=Cyberlindnera jadinii (strain ATCC 18201 / CBS 1600 / BCRC 20928 / JCM 3617 / NBRC 0987 / NRRL Y-1542) TaxID=983966 RepID=A0A0H5C750_CYBJN|nr:unnamed protein product [Cyberlindnera jadinii]